MGTQTSGVGIVATTPGDDESHSGHIATRMMVAVFLSFHDKVHVFTRDTAVMEFEEDNVILHNYEKPMADAAMHYRLLGQFIYQLKICFGIFQHRNQLDLIFISSSGALFIVLASKLASIFTIYRVGGALYLQQPEASLKQRLWREFLKTVEKSTYSLSDKIVVISESQAEFVHLDGNRGKTCVWNHYHFDLNQFKRTTEHGNRGCVVGHIGVSDVKGTNKFIDSLSEIEGAIVEKAIVIGDGNLMQEARQKAANCDIEIEFTGRVERKEMPSLFNQMSFLVICSESEGVPKAALESMACGTPVVANDVGGVADYIRPEKNGLIIQDNDPDTITMAIESMVSRENIGEMSDMARQSVERNFSLEEVKSSYKQFVSNETTVEL